MASHYDAAIIGTGQAGPSLANRLTQAGMRVAVIEQGRFGGTCVNNGCIPTKTLVASAYAAHMVARAAEKWQGVDESVVERVAKEHGREAHKALIDTDQGDLLLFVFLLAGVTGGFVAGYNWKNLMSTGAGRQECRTKAVGGRP